MKVIAYNNKLYNKETGKRISLTDNAEYDIFLENSFIADYIPEERPLKNSKEKADEATRKDERNNLIAPAGTELYFQLKLKNFPHLWAKCLLLEDLWGHKTEAKNGEGCHLVDAACHLVKFEGRNDIPFIEQIEAKSLTELYREVARLYTNKSAVNKYAGETFYIRDGKESVRIIDKLRYKI